MITLYHGSNVDIEKIDLSLSRKGKDFGCGFYLNANKQQAMDAVHCLLLYFSIAKYQLSDV